MVDIITDVSIEYPVFTARATIVLICWNLSDCFRCRSTTYEAHISETMCTHMDNCHLRRTDLQT